MFRVVAIEPDITAQAPTNVYQREITSTFGVMVFRCRDWRGRSKVVWPGPMKATSAGGVRLKVAYKSPQALIGELTKSVGRGGVRIESKRAVPVGTKFTFELHAQGVSETVDVLGTVLTVTESQPGKFVLHIRYEPPDMRDGIDAIIAKIFKVSDTDPKRRAPRVPLHVRAVENRPESPTYRLRDVSRVGVGIDVDGDHLPAHVHVGMPFSLSMKLLGGMMTLPGEVVWAVSASPAGPLPPRIGVAFGVMSLKMQDMLDGLISLRSMPPPPWIAKLAFGSETER